MFQAQGSEGGEKEEVRLADVSTHNKGGFLNVLLRPSFIRESPCDGSLCFVSAPEEIGSVISGKEKMHLHAHYLKTTKKFRNTGRCDNFTFM